jgi:hypothetical protein
MAINEAEELRNLLSNGLGDDGFYQDFIGRLSNDIVKEFKDGINKNTKGSGALASSVVAVPTRSGFEVQADFYYKFIDEGVNAAPSTGIKTSRPLVTGAPYSFKNLGVSKDFAKSMKQYAGANVSHAYAIAVSIKKHGIKAKDITDKVVTNDLLEQIAEDLATLTGLAFGVVFDRNTKDAIE